MLKSDPENYLPKKNMTKRVVHVKKLVEKSMNDSRVPFNELGSILNEETIKQPLVIRRVMAEAKKLKIVPKYIWDKQIFAGSIAYNNPSIQLGGELPLYATDIEIAYASNKGLSQNSTFGHIVPNYPKLLKLGISGILETISIKESCTSDIESLNFLEATRISLLGLASYAKEYAEICRKTSENCKEANRKKELIEMAQALEYSPYNPPKTLYQAMQTIWLTHVAFQLTGNSLAMGRVDQYLYEYFESDMQNGLITMEECQEMFDLFFLKYNERAQNNQVQASKIDALSLQERMDKQWHNRSTFDRAQQHYNVRDSIDATNHWLQNVVLGGIDPITGNDASNILSLVMLESFQRLQKTNPVITVRINSNTPKYLYEKSAQTLIDGGGQPTFFNDDTIIPSLISHGIEQIDARDYTNDGCWEIIVPGRTDFLFHKINILKCLEWTLNHGKSRLDNKQEAPDIGSCLDLSFDEIIAAFWGSVEYVIDGMMNRVTTRMREKYGIAPVPLLSALLEGPIENGMDMTNGGAKFITCGLIAEGMSHLIDSLTAIKQVVFTEKSSSMSQLIDALNANFVGYESLRIRLNNCAKYGNNDNVADAIGKKVVESFASRIKEINLKYPQVLFMPGAGTFSWYIAVGEGTGPSPDGRLSKKPVSSNFSPSASSMQRGVTAAIISHARMNTGLLSVGSPLDLGLNSRYVQGSNGHNRLIALLKSFVELGGNMLTLTIADTQTLRDAQQNPEDYRDLRVRMGGWSAYFTMLSNSQQEHHIKKSEGGIF